MKRDTLGIAAQGTKPLVDVFKRQRVEAGSTAASSLAPAPKAPAPTINASVDIIEVGDSCSEEDRSAHAGIRIWCRAVQREMNMDVEEFIRFVRSLETRSDELVFTSSVKVLVVSARGCDKGPEEKCAACTWLKSWWPGTLSLEKHLQANKQESRKSAGREINDNKK